MQSSAGVCAGVIGAVRKSCPKRIGGALELSTVLITSLPQLYSGLHVEMEFIQDVIT